MGFVFSGALRGDSGAAVLRRSAIIAMVSFLTLIDLFGSQALLPQLVTTFGADPAVMGLAVNASTLGMAVSGLLVGWFADRINRKRGIWLSLLILAAPTYLLGVVDDVAVFAGLRILQGLCMAAAFTLTMTYLSEQCDKTATGGAMAAYITGNVAANLLGRILAVSAADLAGLHGSFTLFAGLNLAGAVLAFSLIGPSDRDRPTRNGSPLAAWREHLGQPSLRAAFMIGFTLLFAFVGVFTYVNFYLVDALAVPAALLGVIYLVFLPSLATTPFAGAAVRRLGSRPVFWIAVALTIAGLAATLAPALWLVLVGLTVVGAATFFAQAAATGFVSRTAQGSRAAANGLYLTSYYLGGLVGAFALGQAYGAFGWPAVAGIIAAMLVLAAGLARSLVEPERA